MATNIANVVEALRHTENEEQLMMALNEESVAWNLLGNNGKSFVRLGGRGMNRESIITQLPERISGTTEGGSIPSAIAMDTEEANFSAQPVVGVWETSWSLLMRARRSRDAFKNAVDMHQDGLRTGFIQEMSVEMLRNGNGALAVLSAADDNATQTNLAELPAVRRGMVLDNMDTDLDTKHADSVSVTAEDKSVPQFTVSGAPSGSAAGDIWVREDTTDDSLNDALHIVGLQGIVSNADPPTVVGDYAGIDRATAGNEFWESPVLANGATNRSLTADLMLQALHVRRDVGGKSNRRGMRGLAWLMPPAIERRYVEIFEAVRFVDTGSGPFSGDAGPKFDVDAKGAGNFTFSGIKIHTDTFHPANTIFLLDLDTFAIGYVDSKVPQPIDKIFSGQIPFFRQTSNTTFEKVWYWEGSLVNTAPRRSVQIQDVSHT